MKILVTGGDSKFAKALKNENPDLYYNPGKFELNLLETDSVKKYTSIITEVDGIILNANTFHHLQLIGLMKNKLNDLMKCLIFILLPQIN